MNRGVDLMQYMYEHPGDKNDGGITVRPNAKHKRVALEMHYCTAMLDQQEAFQVFVALNSACVQQWGQEWNDMTQRYLEHLYAHE